ncbi:MAG: NADH-quinone oxidoreductase subunit C [Campylobacterota bacterium]|nr:NADH-quinone oxidoreductase subunit C [Campylobacterota bacterium]
MRQYTPKKDVQKKSYYNDRFYVTPQLTRESIYNDPTLSNDHSSLTKVVDVSEAYIELDHLVMVIEPQTIMKTLTHVRDVLCYDFLMEITAVDYIADRGGFEIVYELLSTSKHKRMRIKAFIKQNQAIDSVTSLYMSADWAEREMFDMYGVTVKNHHYMKRLIMPDDWNDHPLLKTYPMIGDEAAQWYEVDKIFGKEARDVIGPEIRDQAAVDRYDTQRFSRLGHEVPYGVDITDGKEPEHTPLAYQEEEGVQLFGKRLVQEFDENTSVTLEKRR